MQGNTIYVENFEMLLSSDISKQVILESYYFLGVMLLFLENLIPGPVREKIVVCHVRIIGGQNTLANLHEITKLCKKTGFLPSWYPYEDKRTAMLNLPQDKKTITEFSFTGKMFARMGVDGRLPSKISKDCEETYLGCQGRRYLQRNPSLPEPRTQKFCTGKPSLDVVRRDVLHP